MTTSAERGEPLSLPPDVVAGDEVNGREDCNRPNGIRLWAGGQSRGRRQAPSAPGWPMALRAPGPTSGQLVDGSGLLRQADAPGRSVPPPDSAGRAGASRITPRATIPNV